METYYEEEEDPNCVPQEEIVCPEVDPSEEGEDTCVPQEAIVCSPIQVEKQRQVCNACTTGIDVNSCSIHYSGMTFTDTVMIDGLGYRWTNIKADTSTGMPTQSGNGTMIGNTGNGFAKISTIIQSNNNKDSANLPDYIAYLDNITSDLGDFDEPFMKERTFYHKTVNYYNGEIVINAASNVGYSIQGAGFYELEVGANNIPVSVTTPDGFVNVYTIIVNRNDVEEVNDSLLKYIDVAGYNRINVIENTYDYDLSISPSETELIINPVPYDKDADIRIYNFDNLHEEEGYINIYVTGNNNSSTYRIKYKKDGYIVTTFDYDSTEFEVVGNIYDNKLEGFTNG